MLAMKMVQDVREEFKRREEIQMKLKEAIAEKMRKEEEREMKRVEKLERYTETIIHFGLWQTEQDVNEALKSINSLKENKKAI